MPCESTTSNGTSSWSRSAQAYFRPASREASHNTGFGSTAITRQPSPAPGRARSRQLLRDGGPNINEDTVGRPGEKLLVHDPVDPALGSAARCANPTWASRHEMSGPIWDHQHASPDGPMVSRRSPGRLGRRRADDRTGTRARLDEVDAAELPSCV